MEQDVTQNSDSKKYYFPKELLNASIEERKSYFRDYVVEHQFLKDAVNSTVSFVTSQVSERLVFVCGPSGVGKKKFVEILKKRIDELEKPTLIENPGCIPVVEVEAIAPEERSFNFANLWRSVLVNLNEPMIGQKVSYSERKDFNGLGQYATFSQLKKADFLEVLQKALRNRGVKALIIDEAHHMLRVANGKKLNWSVDLLKSLTNGSHTPIILVGTYELTTFLEDLDIGVTDQLNQRTKIVSFPRYNCDDNKEKYYFGNITKLLLLNMPLKETAEKLVDGDWRYFYKHSLGCIGSLKIWLMDALSLALEEGAKTLTKEHLEKTKKPGYICSGMYKEIKEGEQKIARILSDGDIEKELGFSKSENEPKNEPKNDTNNEPKNDTNNEPENDSNKRNSKKKLKPFENCPKRHNVGMSSCNIL